ncbi:regulation of nuclear pre-mRNA domain-containing protein 2 isoform X2 [Hypomesus transpacificus]|uniref:regulation of nuclear pre-mRNA domain-containing protein 2 isoform X2 n=1 Tax=Hypomesus transpacificus TaxID=137520 RepID=UPI001F07D425|nr:regulation of nuclear pre-mRNA domain-containing protein 2 isoform X2 [Hypomesus transpacificus]
MPCTETRCSSTAKTTGNMAADSEAASGHGARGSSAGLEASLDRRFQGVSNTMESIQGLSTWCIENKKYHSLIVRYWMKWLKKSDTNHRLNLFYLANDVIQNCKRKNAIVYRPAFAEVLPRAALLVTDGKVRRSVERIFTIWEERSVYPEELISLLKTTLARKERERERDKEKDKDKEREREREKEKVKQKETIPAPAPANPKAALKSKIVAEFTPQSFIEQLCGSKRVVAEEEMKEKLLTALRVDVGSTEALKRLKDKAEGNKFSKDFEDSSLKLQEFVSFLETQLSAGPPLLEALGNADVFYEMQYKEVKIVANAYNTFANRVSSLKRKLDALKSTLPGSEESPVPSPSEDAPSPTGSDSPFLELGAGRGDSMTFDPELDGRAMDDGELGRAGDNRVLEDMELSEEETDTSIIVENKTDKSSSSASKTTKPVQSAAASKRSPSPTPTKTPPDPFSKKTGPPAPAPAPALAPAPAFTGAAPPSAGQGLDPSLGVNLANVDLGKISSILSSITSAMKNTAVSPVSRPSPRTPTTPSGQSSSSKPAPPSPALASILSRVDISPEGILSALSKTSTQGLSSLLQSVTGNPPPSSSGPPSHSSPESSSAKAPPTTKPPLGNSLKRETGRTRDWEKERECSPPPPPPPPPSAPAACVSPPSLESKINSFLQGNPGFSLGLGDGSPLLGGEGVDGTPVRDETGGTPTQDEIMDTLGGDPGGHNLSPTAYRSDPWDAVITPTGSSSDSNFLSSSSSRGQSYGSGKKVPAGKNSAKTKEEQALKTRRLSGTSSLSLAELKAKKEGHPLQRRAHAGERASGERRASAGSRKASSGSEDGGLSGRREEKGRGRQGGTPGGEGAEGQYHRIETLVSPCTEGAPIHTLNYSNRLQPGERIQTVESIRVIGRGMRHGGGAGGRPGGGMWYEEGSYPEVQPPSPTHPHGVPPPVNASPDTCPIMPPLPPPHLLPPHHTLLGHPHPLAQPPSQFQMTYHGGDNPQNHPPHLHQHPPPPSPFFSSPPLPIPRPPPPPMPQAPPHNRNFPGPPSAVMVGGVLVPVDRPLPLPPPSRPDGADRGGIGGPRGGKGGPVPLMLSLLGEPPKLPRSGTVKEHFTPRHAPPLHRPGTPGAPPPLLGRVKEGLNITPPSPTSSSTPPPPSPSGDPPRPQAPSLQRPPTSPPAVPRNPRRPSPPVSLLRLPNPSPRPPILPSPMGQRPLLRARGPPTPPNHDPHMFRGVKRPGPPFGRGQGGPFHPPKRPFLPPRY